MAERRVAGLTLFVLGAFGLTAAGILLQRPADGVLRVERWSAPILAAAREAGLGDPYLLAGLVITESRGDPGAVSSAGAEGLCQLLPGTAADLARRLGVPGPPYRPADNLRMGAFYLQEQLDRFADRDLALLAYRLGPAAVQRESAAAGGTEAWIALLKSRKPSPWEYRTKVIRFRDRFAERAAAGVSWPSDPGADAE